MTISSQKSGLDIAKYINKTAPLPFIFLTSHSDIRTIAEVTKTKPAGYLSKPFKEVDVTLALNIYFQNEPQTDSLFKLNIGKNNYFLDLASIQYVETNHVYSNIVMSEKKILIRTPLSNLIDLLPAGSLIRVNRSTAVNTKYLTSISNNHIHLQNKKFKLSSVYYDEYKHLNHEL
uniref:LytR/AlgR family response regulator transcription factor n=1 Tax=Flavobacterium sp. TaxID=239 RepID=UPI004049CB8C